MGKDFEMPPGWEHVGRSWGVIGRADLPLSECETFVEPTEGMARFRRIVRRYLQAKGIKRRGRGAVRLFTEQHLQWARVLDWASGNPLPPLEEALAATAAKRSAEHVPPNKQRFEEGAQPSSRMPFRIDLGHRAMIRVNRHAPQRTTRQTGHCICASS